MRRIYLLLSLIFCFHFLLANMGSPEPFGGALGGRPFVNKYVDINKETLKIVIDHTFEYAEIDAVYYIESRKDGVKIPLLFYASDYENNFQVSVDGNKVEILPIPEEYYVIEGTKFIDFAYLFTRNRGSGIEKDVATITSDPDNKSEVRLHDLKYFETDITKGKHIIEVSYNAHKWTDPIHFLNEYSFRYDLSPVKQWKSFSILELTIINSGYKEKIRTNLREPYYGSLDSLAKWKFNNLPAEIILITTKPKIALWQKIVIILNPFGVWLFLILIIFCTYDYLLKYLRSRKPDKKFIWLLILGLIFTPVFIPWLLIKYDQFALNSLGIHAGTRFFRRFDMFGGTVLFYFATLMFYLIWIVTMIIRLDRSPIKKR